jgi:hypothetical protein
MWILLGILQRAATLLVIGLATAFSGMLLQSGATILGGVAIALVAGPAVALVSLYAVVVSTLHQLALHSLVHNRRGVASALVHAWRIARHAPVVTARAVATDLVLYVSVAALTLGVKSLTDGLGGTLVTLSLAGFAGVTRAGFWARAYRALGGLSPDDGVPGLAGSPELASARAGQGQAELFQAERGREDEERW